MFGGVNKHSYIKQIPDTLIPKCIYPLNQNHTAGPDLPYCG